MVGMVDDGLRLCYAVCCMGGFRDVFRGKTAVRGRCASALHSGQGKSEVSQALCLIARSARELPVTSLAIHTTTHVVHVQISRLTRGQSIGLGVAEQFTALWGLSSGGVHPQRCPISRLSSVRILGA